MERMIFALARYATALEEKICVDSLTGLGNQQYLRHRLSQEFTRAARYGRDLSLLFLDIDHFKVINDTYGHELGNAVLVKVSSIIQDSIRKTDIAARYGGEEFVVVLPETPAQGAVVAAERIRDSVAHGASLGRHFGRVTVSVGVSYYPDSAASAEDLLCGADSAMYQAKRGGRNRTTVLGGDEIPGDVPDPERSPLFVAPDWEKLYL